MGAKAEKTLLLLTSGYPFSSKELPFLRNEIPALENEFDRIYIMPFENRQKSSLKLPKGIELLEMPEFYRPVDSSFLVKARYGLKILNDLLKRKKLLSFSFFKFYVSQFSQVHSRCKIFEKGAAQLLEKENLTIYSFWTNNWVYLLDSINTGSAKIVTRVHNYDVYESRNLSNYIPFFEDRFRKVERIYVISSLVREHLCGQAPRLSEKAVVSYLGSEGHEARAKKLADPPIRILSCSHVTTVKRVELVADILSQLDVEVHWTHIGGGGNFNQLKQKVDSLPDNIKIDLKGVFDHDMVLDYLVNNWVDVFINVSTHEGLPVSIMEAISFGIPILATEVGGVSEIVNEQVGALLSSNFQLSDAKEKLMFLFENFSRDEDKREVIKSFWRENFNAEVNYRDFAENIGSL